MEFPLAAGVLLVGRDEEADIRVDEALVSRAHARIERRGGAFFVLDLGSTNLTKVNGEPVRERELRDGDELHFARTYEYIRNNPGAAGMCSTAAAWPWSGRI